VSRQRKQGADQFSHKVAATPFLRVAQRKKNNKDERLRKIEEQIIRKNKAKDQEKTEVIKTQQTGL